jgi:transcriptional regulator with XRE-family HTH domain
LKKSRNEKEEEPMTFGAMLQKLRLQLGLSQSALAGKSGVPVRTIQGWEQDYRCPVSVDFFKIARALGVSADAFALMEMSAPTAVKKQKPRKGPRRHAEDSPA